MPYMKVTKHLPMNYRTLTVKLHVRQKMNENDLRMANIKYNTS